MEDFKTRCPTFLLGEVGGRILRRVPLDLSLVDHPGDLGRELLDELTDPGPVAPVPFDRVVDVKVAGAEAVGARSPSARNLGLVLSECDRRLTTLRGWQSQRRAGFVGAATSSTTRTCRLHRLL